MPSQLQKPLLARLPSLLPRFLRSLLPSLLCSFLLALGLGCDSSPAPALNAVSITPSSATVVAKVTVSFSATVLGALDPSVTWSVQEGTGGTISQAGVYNAPATPGRYHVVATSAADRTRAATAAVEVTAAPPPVAISIQPATANIAINASQTFSAVVTGSLNTSAVWSVQENGGGTISSDGVYTAPAIAGDYQVIATAAADTSKHAIALATVNGPGQATLVWTDPASGTYQLRRSAALSTRSHLVLELTGAGAPSGAAIAFTLSSDPALTTWSKVASADPDLVQNGAVLTLGGGVQALKAKVAGGVLQAVVGQKGLGGATSLSGVLARVALNPKRGAAAGKVAFTAPKAQVLQASGAITTETIAVGTLSIQ